MTDDFVLGDVTSPEQRRAWQYLSAYQTASADEVHQMTGVPMHVAVWCVNRIGTPYAIRAIADSLLPVQNVPSPIDPTTAGPALGEGRKFDSDKPRYDLLPPELLSSVADVLTFGARKYGERNWEQGMSWGRPFAALMRHVWAWWRGEDRDPETGMSHLAHAACCVAFLLAYEARGSGTDDRPRR